jgi:hypothetical protein
MQGMAQAVAKGVRRCRFSMDIVKNSRDVGTAYEESTNDERVYSQP